VTIQALIAQTLHVVAHGMITMTITTMTMAILGILGIATMMVILGIRGTVEMIAPGKKLNRGD
jgi:hypothetical protein